MNRIDFKLQLLLPVAYKGMRHDCGYRIDLLVKDSFFKPFVLFVIFVVKRILNANKRMHRTLILRAGY